jgi:hypothetical protein
MAVAVLTKLIPRVAIGTAPGTGKKQYFIGSDIFPDVSMLLVDPKRRPALLKGVKYSKHAVGDPLKGRVPADEQYRVTMLLEGGPWYMSLWDKNEQCEVKLWDRGDYVAWEPGVEHEWRPLGTATMLTVGFLRCERTAEGLLLAP